MTFFGYDWHGERFRRYLSHFSGVHRIAHMHGFIHGHIAADRAKHTFGLSERECEAIARHIVSAGGHAAHANRVDHHRGG